LCNMISPALDSSLEDSITDQQLDVYLSGKREDDVIIRLLDSRDPKTNLATLHLIHNIVRDSVPRQ
jgi:ataxin-10